MNEELKQKANEMLLKLLTGMEQAGDFAMAEIPEVIEQLILYKTVYYTSIEVISIITLVSFIMKLRERSKAFAYDSEDGPTIIVTCIHGLAAIAFLIAALACFPETMMLWFAPKLFLLEYARGLVG